MEDAEKIFDEMKEYFGSKLANPDQYPRIFEYQMRIYKYITYENKETPYFR